MMQIAAKTLRAVVATLVIVSTAYAQKITKFDPAGSTATVVQGMNSSGQITGYFQDAAGLHGFLRQPGGHITSFDVPNNDLVFTVPTAINWAGEIVGYFPNEGFTFHSFVRAPNGTITTFEVPAQFSASSIKANAVLPFTPTPPRGSILGEGDWPNAVSWDGKAIGAVGSFSYNGYIRDKTGNFTIFSVTPQTSVIPNTQPQATNWAGDIAGYYLEEDGEHGFLRKANGAITVFAVPNARTIPTAINFLGQIAGYYTDDSGDHAFMRDCRGAIIKFDPKGSTSTRATAISETGEITGFYADAAGIYHGFDRKPDGKLKTFSVPGAGSGNSQGTFPQAINFLGQIAGFYQDVNSVLHGFILNQ